MSKSRFAIRRRSKTASSAQARAGLSLALAELIVRLEAYASAAALPAMVAGVFVAFAWLGIFAALYPWAHMALLALFTAWFFAALRFAREHYRAPPSALARRRLEAANRLAHRPLDVMDDRLAGFADEAQHLLWRAHVERSAAQLKNLRVPRWGLRFAERDPYAVRYAVAVLLVTGMGLSWGGWGGALWAALNPPLRPDVRPVPVMLNAWIAPPEYTALPPIMIATPSGDRLADEVIAVPEGSVLSVHWAERGDAPTLEANGATIRLSPDDHGDFAATTTLTRGEAIALRRGWHRLGSWRVRLVPDTPPQVAFVEPPTPTAQKTTRLAYEASDDYGVQTVALRVTPTMSVPGLSGEPVEVALAAPQAKQVKQVDFQDLTPLAWAGLPVEVQLVATDAAGHVAQSAKALYTLPERDFLHPLARALGMARKRLLQQPDEHSRETTANMMAGMARQTGSYRGDAVVMMALCTAAVRLVLGREDDTIAKVADVMWQTAARIEDGSVGQAQKTFRDAQRDLAAALAQGASEAQIQALIDRYQIALARYLDGLMARQPAASEDLALGGASSNVLTPDDLRRMLDQMRGLSAAGSRDEARRRLEQLQQLIENIQTAPPRLSAEQKALVRQMNAARDLAKAQQQLLDQTFKVAHEAGRTPSPQDAQKLAVKQNELLRKLRDLIGKKNGAPDELNEGAAAMEGAAAALGRGDWPVAQNEQGEAVAALQKGVQAMRERMQAQAGSGGQDGLSGRDPFGRSSGALRDGEGVKIPDQITRQRVREILDELQRRAGESGRPKAERDYIDRLLKRF